MAKPEAAIRISQCPVILQLSLGKIPIALVQFSLTYRALFAPYSEVGGRTLYRLLVRDAAGETEGVLLKETVPSWVVDIVVQKNLPKFIRMPFYLLPHSSSGFKSLKK